jgi:hypothetical protein
MLKRIAATRNPTESSRCAVMKNQIVRDPKTRVPRTVTDFEKLTKGTVEPRQGITLSRDRELTFAHGLESPPLVRINPIGLS